MENGTESALPPQASQPLSVGAPLSLTPEERRRLLFVGATMLVSLVGSLISSLLHLGPKSAFFITPALGASFVVYTLWARDAFTARMLVFGLVVGFGELPSDYYGVVVNQTLVYPPEPLIWVSPLYMPISWMVMMLQLGTVADVLVRWQGLARATLGLAVLGGLSIPLYETLAHNAGWWWYQKTPMIFGITPYYVILAEMLLSMVLPWMVSRVAQARGFLIPAVLGVAQAAWILIGGVIAFNLVGL